MRMPRFHCLAISACIGCGQGPIEQTEFGPPKLPVLHVCPSQPQLSQPPLRCTLHTRGKGLAGRCGDWIWGRIWVWSWGTWPHCFRSPLPGCLLNSTRETHLACEACGPACRFSRSGYFHPFNCILSAAGLCALRDHLQRWPNWHAPGRQALNVLAWAGGAT